MSEILILSTLHHFHGDVDFYTYDHLAQIIKRFAPDVLACELTPEDLAARKPQNIKQEYQHSVYPLLDELACEVVPLEPGEPLYSELAGKMKAVNQAFMRDHPAAMEQFSLYVEALSDVLFGWWRSPADVNSAETDRHFEVKRRYQNALFGEEEAAEWERWNQHFLDQILAAAERHPKGRVLVLVGAEHSYWLRKRLRQQPGVHLLEAPAVLSDIFSNGA